MEINTLGIVLKYYRKKYEIVLEDLCDGICVPAIASSVEAGEKVVDSLMAESLLGRLGKTVLQFELLLNDKDYVLWNLREEIKKAEQIEDYIQVERLLKKYHAKMPSKSVHKQFYLYYCAKCKMFDAAPKEIICQMLYEALMLTKAKADKRNVVLYNPLEIEMILLLHRYEFSKWIHKDIEAELYNILIFVRKMYSGRLKQKVGTQILLELVSYEQKIGDYIRAIKYADEAIAFLSQGRSLEHIAELHFIKAQMIEKLYNRSEKWETEKHACKRECLMAYYVFDIMEQEDKRAELENYCEEKLGWQITE